ncbi:MAG: biotin--[acetyl-CoA-carboxylase] ligase [Clostridiales bacterium]|jgi:BirA family biotin operon repressor/biotin-[acetyl-CoA-carboxylase] ligase|nr:biotin--[acetyl-CoA-carboxylase] ligase [Clostridiales bacterium]
MRIFNIPEVDSTNLEARRLLCAGKADYGDLILAETQRAGRGRGTHLWCSPAGGVYASLIVPKATPAKITITAGVAVAEVLSAEIKWINDILLNNKKICGILAETCGNAAILGFGVNVNTKKFPDEISKTATSLFIETGNTFDIFKIATDISEKFLLLQQEDFSFIIEKYRKKCVTLGTTVNIRSGTKNISGIAEEIDSLGCLVIRKNNQETETIMMPF